MKRILQIVLAIAIIALAYIMYRQIATPLRFEKETKERSEAVVERLSDIRAAERAYKSKYDKFTDNFDTLIHFVLNDELQFERKLVDENDSLAMARLKAEGLQNSELFMIRAIDTIFSPKKLTEQQVRDLRYIPGTDNKTQFEIEAGTVETESKVVIPVVEVRAPYKDFLDTVKYRQQVINLVDDRVKNFNEYGGLKFGSMEKGNNEAGNWGDQ